MKNKKALYESIMTSVAKEVKKALNEELSEDEYDKIPEDAGFADENGEVYAYDGEPEYKWYKYFGDCINTVDVDEMWDATQMAQVLRESAVLDDITQILPKLINGDRKIPGKLKQKFYDLQRFKNLDQIHDMSEIVAAINEEQEILIIYVSDFDTHFFFDCIEKTLDEQYAYLNEERVMAKKFFDENFKIKTRPGFHYKSYVDKNTGAYVTAEPSNGKPSGTMKFFAKHGISKVYNGSIGFSEKEQKWYGWSHRAIYGFGIGSKVKKGDCGYNGKTWTAKTLDDAKQMAKDFADAVS